MSSTDDEGLRERLKRHEADLIVEALRQAGWNQTEAARRLKLPRRTLVYKLRALGIAKLGYGPADGEPTDSR
jgi:two-component system, NtrC family, response regulator AtoC